MGKCVVACVGAIDGDATDGDCFVSTNVLVGKRSDGIGRRQSHNVGTLFSDQRC